MSPDDRARELLDSPEKRVAYIAWLRRKLQTLKRREAPMAERASVRALLERLESAHAIISVIQRASLVSN